MPHTRDIIHTAESKSRVSPLKTSTELMEELGIANRRTLHRWAETELIPKPKLQKNPAGGGMIGTWEDWVLQHCKEVKRRQELGYSNAKIVEALGTDWEQIANLYRRKYIFSRESEAIDSRQRLDGAAAILEQQVSGSLRSSSALFASSSNTITLAHLEQAIELVHEGYSPVLVVIEHDIRVVSDIAATRYICQADDESQPVTVVPLLGFVKKHLDVKQPSTCFKQSNLIESTARKKQYFRAFIDKNMTLKTRKAKLK